MSKRYICEDCGATGKGRVRILGGNWNHGAMLCEDCIDARQEKRWAERRAKAVCRDCGKPANNCLGLPENPASWQCDSCRNRSAKAAWALREKMLAAGGLDLSPTAY